MSTGASFTIGGGATADEGGFDETMDSLSRGIASSVLGFRLSEPRDPLLTNAIEVLGYQFRKVTATLIPERRKRCPRC